MIADLPRDFVEEQAAYTDAYMTIEMEVWMRFGRWQEILDAPEPPAYLPISAAYRHFARGSALAAKGRLGEAGTELEALRGKTAALPDGAAWINNPAKDVLAIAERVLVGEIAAQRGEIDAAVAALNEAAKLERELVYDEPPDWIQPVRHVLGAVLLKAGRVEEAARAYREDLARFPGNVWSLYGLKRSLEKRGATAEAAEVSRQFDQARARSDVQIGTTCFCIPSV
jgi:tetratricopeptide (TPR) repeat protein